ncbi:MAG: putative metal-binding motif-containing protein [Deltaproteobacteria bacterium]|nr:putative metal-binding motif-containing protein [Deltaproteobacteria bacterium]
MPMTNCAHCGTHVFESACACPHCGTKLRDCGLRHTAAAALMGLALVGCGDKEPSDSGYAPEYGVADTSYLADADGDGVTVGDGDCNDDDAAVNPGATETAGDGVDSNCDGSDDT